MVFNSGFAPRLWLSSWALQHHAPTENLSTAIITLRLQVPCLHGICMAQICRAPTECAVDAGGEEGGARRVRLDVRARRVEVQDLLWPQDQQVNALAAAGSIVDKDGGTLCFWVRCIEYMSDGHSRIHHGQGGRNAMLSSEMRGYEYGINIIERLEYCTHHRMHNQTSDCFRPGSQFFWQCVLRAGWHGSCVTRLMYVCRHGRCM